LEIVELLPEKEGVKLLLDQMDYFLEDFGTFINLIVRFFLAQFRLELVLVRIGLVVQETVVVEEVGQQVAVERLAPSQKIKL